MKLHYVVTLGVCVGTGYHNGVVGNPQPAAPPDEVDYNSIKATVKCRVFESVRSWMDVAERVNRTLDKMATSFADIKPYFRNVYDQMKGTAEILSALPNVTAMSREAHYQVDHYCQHAPIGIQNFVQILRAKSPAFSGKFSADLKVLEDSATLMIDKLKAC